MELLLSQNSWESYKSENCVLLHTRRTEKDWKPNPEFFGGIQLFLVGMLNSAENLPRQKKQQKNSVFVFFHRSKSHMQFQSIVYHFLSTLHYSGVLFLLVGIRVWDDLLSKYGR